MKLAYPVAEPAYKGKVKAFTGGYGPAFAWMKEHGYEGVELLIANPDTVDTAQLDGELARYGLNVAAVGTSPMQIGEKLFLIHPDPENRREARRRASGLLRLCARYGAPALIGKYRGQLSEAPGCSEADLEEVLRDVCREAEKLGVTVLLEPQNKTNINNINTISDGLDWISRLGCKNTGLLADVYHMGITEPSATDSVKMAAGQIGFVHMSDSERKTPGDGALPVRQVVKVLEESGYKGYISLEIDQKPDPETAAARSARYLKECEAE
ncbi:MAG: sugar phosphate isomerase/epimerase [Eubacteriales bacterium]|nr:sugar phosphate isomerase/epimerase [Eubacteriales bacterium]